MESRRRGYRYRQRPPVTPLGPQSAQWHGHCQPRPISTTCRLWFFMFSCRIFSFFFFLLQWLLPFVGGAIWRQRCRGRPCVWPMPRKAVLGRFLLPRRPDMFYVFFLVDIATMGLDQARRKGRSQPAAAKKNNPRPTAIGDRPGLVDRHRCARRRREENRAGPARGRLFVLPLRR